MKKESEYQFVINNETSFDENGNQFGSLTVELLVCGYSQGFIEVDRPENLRRMRDAIDEYLKQNNL
jgi:hypothetical protein